MKKPFTSEIVKLCAEHSGEAAARMSAWKWDFYRRQKIEDISEGLLSTDCALCDRFDTCNKGCYLSSQKQNTQGHCYLYDQAIYALRAKDQQAFTTAANDLYFQIRSIIDDFYKKPEPKKEEVFYHVGQRFEGEGETFRLCSVDTETVNLICERDANRWSHMVKVISPKRITEDEFKQICDSGTFTLIPDTKK